MKITKRQARYLDAIRRCDWTQRNKDGTPAMRKWARDNGMIEYATKAGQNPMWLTEAGKLALANNRISGFEAAHVCNPTP